MLSRNFHGGGGVSSHRRPRLRARTGGIALERQSAFVSSPFLGIVVPDPIHTVDLSSLADSDKLEVEKLRAAYDRAGPRGVAEGMAKLTKTHPELFGWLLRKLTE